MSALKIFFGMAAIVVIVALWTSCGPAGEESLRKVEESGTSIDSSGFVPVPRPDGYLSSGIVIFSPKNCPSDAAQRVERLAEFLEGKGIGFTRSQSASYNNLTSQEEAQRVMAVMNGEIPIVYVNGRAKANPTPEEVEAEYRRSGS